MSVYVDKLRFYRRWGFGGRCQDSCHLLADSREELFKFAEELGLRSDWLHEETLPHFDLTPWKRVAAVRLGAIEISRNDVAALIRRGREAQESSVAAASEEQE